jgi:hypothetical protein
MRRMFNPAPFDAVEWFDVPAFVAGYFYERRGSYIFEVNYGAVIPPAYVIEYSGSQILFQVWIATNVPSGSVCFTKPFLPIRSALNFDRSLTAIC